MVQFITNETIEKDYYAKLKDCKLNPDNSFVALVNALKVKHMDKSTFLSHMKAHRVSKREIDLVTNYFSMWEKESMGAINFETINSILTSEEGKKNKSEVYLNLKPKLDLREKEKNEFKVALVDFLISLNTNNIAWMKKSARKLLLYHPTSFRFNFEKIFEKESDYDIFTEKLSIYLKQKIDKIDEDNLKKMIINHFDNLFFANYGKKLDIDSSYSLSELRDSLKSVIFGKPYFDYWFFRFLGRTSFDESYSTLSAHLSTDVLKKLEDQRLWVLLYYMSGDEAWREQFELKLKTMSQGQDPFLKEIYITLLSDPVVKQMLSKNSKELSAPFFRVQRDHYRKSLESRFNSEYSIFKLISIGDVDRDLFWIYVASKVGVFK